MHLSHGGEGGDPNGSAVVMVAGALKWEALLLMCHAGCCGDGEVECCNAASRQLL